MNVTPIIRKAIEAVFKKRIFVPEYELSLKNLRKCIKMIEKQQPVPIDRFSESLNFFTHHIEQYGLPSMKPKKAIISSAQSLLQYSREIIENAFNCKGFNNPGSREFSGIGYECDTHDGHQVVGESFIGEILNAMKP